MIYNPGGLVICFRNELCNGRQRLIGAILKNQLKAKRLWFLILHHSMGSDCSLVPGQTVWDLL